MKNVIKITILSILSSVLLNAASITKWSLWKPNPRSCTRQCRNPIGIGEFERDCMMCAGDKCANINPSQCYGPAVKLSPCYVSTECTGEGKYTGQMSPWYPTSLCPSPELPCAGNVRKYKRSCQPSDRTNGSAEYDCPGEKLTERQEPCLCEEDDPTTVAVNFPTWGWLPKHGVWSEWSEWSCKQPCVNVTHRNRQCIKMHPDLYDCPMDPEGRLTIDVSPCLINEVALCIKQWTAWSQWSTCGGPCGPESARTQTRQRWCTGHGEECQGPDMELVRCRAEPCRGIWSHWTDWSLCRCGLRQRQRQRQRTCLKEPCIGREIEQAPCPRNEELCRMHYHRVVRQTSKTANRNEQNLQHDAEQANSREDSAKGADLTENAAVIKKQATEELHATNNIEVIAATIVGIVVLIMLGAYYVWVKKRLIYHSPDYGHIYM